MVIRVYVSGISGNKEVKKRQQRVTMILDSKNIEYNVIDIAEPGNENQKEFMQENSKTKDSKYPLPPQIFNGDNYCGDYEEFDMANELDELEKFLNISQDANNMVVENGMSNGPKIDSDKQDNILKEDTRESSQEIVDTVSRTEPETASLDAEIESSVPDEIPEVLDDTRKNSDNTLNDVKDTSSELSDLIKDPGESLGETDNDPKDLDDTPKVLDEIPKTEDEVSKEPVEHESLEKKNIESDVTDEEESTDDTDSEE